MASEYEKFLGIKERLEHKELRAKLDEARKTARVLSAGIKRFRDRARKRMQMRQRKENAP